MKKRSSRKKSGMHIEDSLAFIVEHMATKDDIQELRDDIAELRSRTSAVEKGQDKIIETLEPLSRAHDKDSEAIVDHDKRIVRLEKQIGIRS